MFSALVIGTLTVVLIVSVFLFTLRLGNRVDKATTKEAFKCRHKRYKKWRRIWFFWLPKTSGGNHAL